MASCDPPGFVPVWAQSVRFGGPIYLLIGNFSFELVRGATGIWHFESESRIDDPEDERRRFDPAMVYPDAVTARVADAAQLARAYYDIEIDERVGVAAFGRLAVGLERH